MDSFKPAMQAALVLAARGRGFVEPNPLVGALVLNPDCQVVGEGWHQKFGGPHAEIHALEAAGERAMGGTLIVTLEPCCHWGKTPPCTEAILRSGIRRVVAAMADTFPNVAGGGLRILREAGIEVHVGLCEAETARLNAAYLKLLRTGKPWVHVKWAMSLDGKIASQSGDSRWISCEESRRRVHQLRGVVDAIVVGRGTVVADDPLLTARPPGCRVAARVVITASGKLPERCQLRSTAGQDPVLVFTSTNHQELLDGWKSDGVEIIGLPASGGELPLELVLGEFGRRRFTHILIEGGAGLLGSFITQGLADEFHVFVAPKLVGGAAAPSATSGTGFDRIADALPVVEFSATPSGADVYLHGYGARSMPL